MSDKQPSYNLSYQFDPNLHDVPDAPEEMRVFVQSLEARLANNGLPVRELLRVLGTIGVYARMLGQLDSAALYLERAVALADQVGNMTSRLANSLRLGH